MTDFFDIGDVGGVVSPSGGGSLVTEGVLIDLYMGMLYANIHSNMYPMGEIRGQITEDPSMYPKSSQKCRFLFFYFSPYLRVVLSEKSFRCLFTRN